MSDVVVQLTGPAFLQSALEIGKTIRIHSIRQLQVYPGTGTAELAYLPAALKHLRPYFGQGASVVLFFDPTLISSPLLSKMRAAVGVPVGVPAPAPQGPIPIPYPATSSTSNTGGSWILGVNSQTPSAMAITDFSTAATIATQIPADAQRQQMQRWRILQDTQTKIFAIQQAIALGPAQTAAASKFTRYLR